MSIVSTAANYGGRIDTQQCNIKQFIYSVNNVAIWTFKRLSSNLLVQTPAASKTPVLISSYLIVTGSLYNTSDEKLKKNIIKIDDEKTDNLLTLNPILFSFKNDSTGKKHYGVLAQDVEKVFPELVENNFNSGYKTVNYSELIPIILSKIKKMQSEIDELKQLNK